MAIWYNSTKSGIEDCYILQEKGRFKKAQQSKSLMGRTTSKMFSDTGRDGPPIVLVGKIPAPKKPIRLAILFSVLLVASAQTVDQRDREFWNAKFNDPTTQFRRDPSRLLVDAIKDRQPGRALDLGMGQGRNTIFLAQRGWDATGVDLSDVGVKQALTRAAELHVNIAAIVDTLDHYSFGTDRWDLIALFYMHAWYHGTKPASTKRLVDALKPGGLLVVEGFAGTEKFMFQANELLHDFPELRVLRYEDCEDEAEWAPGHRSRVIRFVAEKTN